VKKLQAAIAELKDAMQANRTQFCDGKLVSTASITYETLQIAELVIKEKLDRMCPKPLTWDEYAQFVNKHVFVKMPDGEVWPAILDYVPSVRQYVACSAKRDAWIVNNKTRIEIYATELKGERT